MIAYTTLFLSLLAQLVAGHFSVDYPYWRGDSFEEPASQNAYPCAGVDQTTSANNRTLWPLGGGAVALDLHHKWTYVFINVGLGNNVSSNFNISLTPQFINVTGNGSFCLPQLTLPTGLVTEGQNATIQVVTSGASGSALYNCADITFSASAQSVSTDQCQNTTGITAAFVAGSSSSTNTSPTNTSSGASASATKSGAEETFVARSLWLILGVAWAVSLLM